MKKHYFLTVFLLVVGVLVSMGMALAQSCNPAGLTPATLGQQGEHVRRFQECLISLGHRIPAGVTGFFGSQTQSAVIDFYKKQAGLTVGGRAFGPTGIAILNRLITGGGGVVTGSVADLTQVKSAVDLKTYFERVTQETAVRSFGRREVAIGLPVDLLESAVSAPGAQVALKSTAERVSETNVQVVGIDEPDSVKTDGQNIYYSKIRGLSAAFSLRETVSPLIAPPSIFKHALVVKAFPPAELAVKSKIEPAGDLLLEKEKDILMVETDNGMDAYNVADPTKPSKIWTSKLESHNQLMASRLTKGKLYLVTRQQPDFTGVPCPIRPLSVNDRNVVIPCLDIWRPVRPVPVDSLYTVLVLDPTSGTVLNKVTLVGSANNSVVYMSPQALYLTNYEPQQYSKFYVDFILEEGSRLLPATTMERIRRVNGYDLSDGAKHFEVEYLIDKYELTLGADDQLKFRNELTDRQQSYANRNKRRLETSLITKINLADLQVVAAGRVPGMILNQFAMDEYEGNLRVAVTIGGRFSNFSLAESANDVYVLDGGLQTIGQIENLGLTERIYSARFVGARGYLVTFRQIDPFYVLDLANPRQPKMIGELKIPGFSSYLHPISGSRVLGVGQEGSKIKVSLFDVSEGTQPKEIDKYNLDEFYSEVLNNHRAFLLDDKHQLFFIPGSQGAYVFSYKNDDLTLTKTLAKQEVQRAIYLDDFLYLIGETSIVVFNELTWEKVGSVDF